MKNTLILCLLLTSSFAQAELKDFNHYASKSCQEMTNLNSEDQFIQFTAKEIRDDLGVEFCSKVASSEHEMTELIFEDEREFNRDQVSPVEYGRLIDSLYQYYQSIH